MGRKNFSHIKMGRKHFRVGERKAVGGLVLSAWGQYSEEKVKNSRTDLGQKRILDVLTV